MHVKKILLFIKIPVLGGIILTSGLASATDFSVKTLLSLSLSELMQLEVITSSGFFPVEVSKSPGYAEIFHQDSIDKSTARSLADFIDGYVPGMQVARQNDFGAVPGVRGLQVDSGTKTMTLYNGIQMSPKLGFGFGHFYDTPLMGDIQRVEIIHGPGAVRYGAGAVNGVINSVSKTGLSHGGFETSVSHGSEEDLYTAEIGYGSSDSEDQHQYVYFGAYTADGFTPDNSYGADLPDNSDSAFAALAYEDVNFRSSYNMQQGQFNMKAVAMSTTANKNSVDIDAPLWRSRNLAVQPSYLFQLGDNRSLELQGSILWWDQAHGRTPTGGNFNQKLSERQIDIRSTYRIYNSNYDLALGGNIAHKEMLQTHQHFSDGDDLGKTDDVRYVHSLFADHTQHLSRNFDLALGLRYDIHDFNDFGFQNFDAPAGRFENEIDDHVSPRIALNYQVTSDFSASLSYQHGFRTPTAEEYFFVHRINQMADFAGFEQAPDLEPETLDSIELNLHFQVSESLSSTVNVFYNEYDNLIGWSGPTTEANSIWTTSQITAISAAGASLYGPGEGFTGRFINIDDKFDNTGIETTFKWQTTNNSHLRISYSYVETTRNLENSFSQYYPRQIVKLDSIWHFLDGKLAIAGNYIYGSDIDDDDISPSPPVSDVFRDDRKRLDLAATYAIDPDVSVKFTIANVNEGDPAPFFDSPERSQLGHGDRRYYLALTTRF